MHYFTNSTAKIFGLFIFAIILNPSIFGQPNFDNDGKADFGVYRTSNRTWYSYSSEAKKVSIAQFGLDTDVAAPADYDGDGITDVAVWRPSNGVWYIMRSRDDQMFTVQWGTTTSVQYGTIADIPVPFDYDGDNQADIAVYRPDPGVWYVLESSQSYNTNYAQISRFGGLADMPVPADYDGDGETDIAVFRTPETRWYIWESSTGKLRSTRFGMQGYDLLAPADYTGDGKADVAVYRSGMWYVERSEDQQIIGVQFGNQTDTPSPS
jgi:hypothetical protein